MVSRLPKTEPVPVTEVSLEQNVIVSEKNPNQYVFVEHWDGLTDSEREHYLQLGAVKRPKVL
jgi:hypothetical protein